jgi:multiple sugar transport system substrate-binding protein
MQACSDAWRSVRPDVEIAWEYRSLMAFGDEPLEEIADRYDLLVIDHPFCGTAAATRTLTPLDQLLDAATLDALAADAVGPSHVSYAYEGSQWGLATDAACQVAAVRDDLLDGRAAPAAWDDVVSLARERPGSVVIPLSPAQAMCAFLTLCANAGTPAAEDAERLVQPDVGRAAIELLAELLRLGPSEALEWQPPDVLQRMTTTDEIVYVPLAFGFVTYARADRVEQPCRFLDVPSAGHGPVGAILGGAGLAVSAAGAHKDEAAAFAAFASGADAQRTIVGPVGGQPGSASAWDDPELDRAGGGFFSGTRATIEQAWVRPRDPFWPAFQLEGGTALNEGLAEGLPPKDILDNLDRLYNDCIRRTT